MMDLISANLSTCGVKKACGLYCSLLPGVSVVRNQLKISVWNSFSTWWIGRSFVLYNFTCAICYSLYVAIFISIFLKTYGHLIISQTLSKSVTFIVIVILYSKKIKLNFLKIWVLWKSYFSTFITDLIGIY